MFGAHPLLPIFLMLVEFVTFIDDCARTTWVYLMKSKFEVPLIFSAFHEFVNTTKIQTLRSNNNKEYFNQELMNYLEQ